MSNYTEEEIQVKRTAFRSQSIRAVANIQTEYSTHNAIFQNAKQKYNSCLIQRKCNRIQIYRDPDNRTRKINIKQLDEKQRQYLGIMIREKKILDDLLDSL